MDTLRQTCDVIAGLALSGQGEKTLAPISQPILRNIDFRLYEIISKFGTGLLSCYGNSLIGFVTTCGITSFVHYTLTSNIHLLFK